MMRAFHGDKDKSYPLLCISSLLGMEHSFITSFSSHNNPEVVISIIPILEMWKQRQS